MTAQVLPSAPAPGEIVRVRQRQYLVEDVQPPPEPGEATLVSMSCLDDDAQGETLEVLWEHEIDTEVVRASWDRLGRRDFDAPSRFAAYLHALRWNCVTATNPRLFQSPWRAGIEVMSYQLEPLRKALRLPRVNLFIADDVGLGKTIEAGLVLREMLMRQRVRRAVVVAPPSVVIQWKEELEQRFGLTFVIYDRDYVARCRRERGYAVNPWITHSRFILSHSLLRDEEYAAPLRDLLRSPVERYGKKYGWIGFFTYAGILDDQGLLPHDSPFSDVDIDPSFPEKPPIDGSSSVAEAWLSPSIESQENWIRGCTTSLPVGIIRRETIGGHSGPWLAVHGHVSAEDRVLGRTAWAFLSALVVSKGHEPRLVAALRAGDRPWGTRDVPSDHYTFAGEMSWHPNFASVALAEGAYREHVRTGIQTVEVEVLAHDYAWETNHSEMNRAGSARVPSQRFSAHFDLRGVAQSFDQVLPDGSPATITLSGVDGLVGDVVYIREDLLRQYVAGRAIVWFAFGERELRPYPPSPPEWLVDAQRGRANAWNTVITEKDLTPSTARARGTGSETAPKRGANRPGSKAKAAAPKKNGKAAVKRKTPTAGKTKDKTSRRRTP